MQSAVHAAQVQDFLRRTHLLREVQAPLLRASCHPLSQLCGWSRFFRACRVLLSDKPIPALPRPAVRRDSEIEILFEIDQCRWLLLCVHPACLQEVQYSHTASRNAHL